MTNPTHEKATSNHPGYPGASKPAAESPLRRKGATEPTETPKVNDLRFTCAHCGQRIATAASARGYVAQCPACHGELIVPSATNAAVRAPSSPAVRRPRKSLEVPRGGKVRARAYHGSTGRPVGASFAKMVLAVSVVVLGALLWFGGNNSQPPLAPVPVASTNSPLAADQLKLPIAQNPPAVSASTESVQRDQENLRRDQPLQVDLQSSPAPIPQPTPKLSIGESQSLRPPIAETSAKALVDSFGDSPPPSVLATIGPRPAQDRDGTVPVMLASLSAGQIKEIEPREIRRWGPLHYYQLGGEAYWAAVVHYTVRTIFGEFPDARALALMRQGRVVKWVYAGTLEPMH
jgi:hypothetical protein